MARPAAREPSRIERSAGTIPGAALGEDATDPAAGVLGLSDDPIAVLTHDGEPVVDHGLSGGEDGDSSSGVEASVSSK
jgi:hypothetical protein